MPSEKINEAEAQFLISVSKEAEIFIDKVSIGFLKIGELKYVKVYPGDHYIDAISRNRQWAWNDKITINAGTQKILEIKLTRIDKSFGIMGTFLDPRDNYKYKTVEINGITWLGENLRFNNGNSYYWKNLETALKVHGRLYDGQLIESACPPGWHIPTEQEWSNLIAFYKGKEVESLVEGGYSNFNLLFSGCAMYSILGGIASWYSRGSKAFFWVDSDIVTGERGGMRKCCSFSKDKHFSIAPMRIELKRNGFLASMRCIRDY